MSYIYEITAPETKKRQFTTKWRVAMLAKKKANEMGSKVRIYRSELVGEITPERMATMMNLALRAQYEDVFRPMFQNSIILASDFGDDHEKAKHRLDDITPRTLNIQSLEEQLQQGRSPETVDLRGLHWAGAHDEDAAGDGQGGEDEG